ncbi:hypothetical protein CKAN_00869600 [Cinnamomum micranthum f. kanehirae]|uniref:Uncharacterized protein n=1 Tax=Cinnamomum micranthum f. kanehirae TaxID=337451 RepID=A0A3S3Q7D3_9MAGN|nr:hypothetical protein CKAN_00869600 [Cinnamomum micranthum f. kanehirae]
MGARIRAGGPAGLQLDLMFIGKRKPAHCFEIFPPEIFVRRRNPANARSLVSLARGVADSPSPSATLSLALGSLPIAASPSRIWYPQRNRGHASTIQW